VSVLLDTNIILRLAQPNHEMHDSARDAVQRLNDQKASLCIVPQVIYEYWVVVTRPVENNGLGMTVKDAETAVSTLLRDLPLLGDGRTVFENWQTLVSKYEVKGKVAHDTRLVAAMLKHSIQDILTFNAADFARFNEICVLTPAKVIDGQRPTPAT
jgi:predicted nucleic acid-binding protein